MQKLQCWFTAVSQQNVPIAGGDSGLSGAGCHAGTHLHLPPVQRVDSAREGVHEHLRRLRLRRIEDVRQILVFAVPTNAAHSLHKASQRSCELTPYIVIATTHRPTSSPNQAYTSRSKIAWPSMSESACSALQYNMCRLMTEMTTREKTSAVKRSVCSARSLTAIC